MKVTTITRNTRREVLHPASAVRRFTNMSGLKLSIYEAGPGVGGDIEEGYDVKVVGEARLSEKNYTYIKGPLWRPTAVTHGRTLHIEPSGELHVATTTQKSKQRVLKLIIAA